VEEEAGEAAGEEEFAWWMDNTAAGVWLARPKYQPRKRNL